MEKDKVLQWLTKSKSTIEPSKYEEIRKDVYQLDTEAFMNKWDSYLKDNVSGWIDFRKPKEKELSVRLREDFGEIGFNPSDKWKNEVYKNKYSDIPRESFEENLANMRQYYEDEIKEREYESGRKRREKEVKDWGKDWFTTPWIRNFLASDYEKRRYIEHPEEALFGEEAPELGEAKNTRWGAMGDLAAGTAGAAADVGLTFVPGLGWIAKSVTGPAIRFGRDVAHKGFSEYQKDWSDILNDAKNDITSNAAFEALPNLRQFSRVMGSEKAGRVNKALEIEDEAKKMKKEFERYGLGPNELKKWNNTEIYEHIDEMPEGTLKNNLKQYAKNIHSIDRAGLADEWDRASKFVEAFEDSDIRNAMKTFIDMDLSYTPKIGERAYESKLLTMPKLTKYENLAKNVQKVGRNIPAQSTPLLKAGTDIIPDEPVDEDIESRKNWYKQNYTRDWLLGFTPEYKEGDPKWEAFEEEFPERAAEVKRNKEK